MRLEISGRFATRLFTKVYSLRTNRQHGFSTWFGDSSERWLNAPLAPSRQSSHARTHARVPRAGGPPAKTNVNPSSVVGGWGCRNFPALYISPRQTVEGVEGRNGKTATPKPGAAKRHAHFVSLGRVRRSRSGVNDIREQRATFTTIEGSTLGEGDFAQSSMDGKYGDRRGVHP